MKSESLVLLSRAGDLEARKMLHRNRQREGFFKIATRSWLPSKFATTVTLSPHFDHNYGRASYSTRQRRVVCRGGGSGASYFGHEGGNGCSHYGALWKARLLSEIQGDGEGQGKGYWFQDADCKYSLVWRRESARPSFEALVVW